MNAVRKTLLLAGLNIMAFGGTAMASDVELRLVVPCVSGLVQYPSPFSDKKLICVSKDVVAGDANIVSVKPRTNKMIGGTVEFQFDHDAQERLAEVTETNVGRQLALLSGGRLVTAAVIESPIRGGVMELNLPDKYRNSVLKLFQDRKLVH